MSLFYNSKKIEIVVSLACSFHKDLDNV
jgi:hypothetical protein